MNNLIPYIYALITLALTIYGQLILKWRSLQYVNQTDTKLSYLISLFKDIWVWTGVFAAVLASISWMLALSKIELSKIYPVMSLAPIVVLFYTLIYMNETINIEKILGTILMFVGTLLIFKS
jgi:drug/metabolite transporter (DMT)-like permease